MTGFKVYADIVHFEVYEKCSVVMWQKDSAQSVALEPDGGEFGEGPRYLSNLEPGLYHLRETAWGLAFSHASVETCQDYKDAFELGGVPIPASLRVPAFDIFFTAVGIELGRLPHMYRVGSDSAATMLLLLNGASRLSLDGYGAHVMPS